MGQGSDTAMAQIAAETLGIADRIDPRRAFRHRHDALRHGDARLALDLSHGYTPCVSPPKTRAPGSRSRPLSRPDVACEDGQLSADAPRVVHEALRHASRQRHRQRFVLNRRATSRRCKTGQSTNVTPFWMVGGAGVEIEVDTETGHITFDRLVNAGDVGTPINPGDRRAADLAAPRSCSSAHRLRGDGIRRRSGHERFARRLQDSRYRSTFRRRESDTDRASRIRALRSEPRASANRVRSACRRRSRTRSTTRSACACANCRSCPNACCARSAPTPARRWRTNDGRRPHDDPLHPQRPARFADVAAHENLIECCSATSRSTARA